MVLRYTTAFFLSLVFFAASAQKKKSSTADPTSFDPKNVDERYVPDKTKKKKKFGRTYEARDEFNDRIEKNWKEREKREKNVSGRRKPDKSQPPYFGHRRQPKIRPEGKRKVCKVCGIKH